MQVNGNRTVIQELQVSPMGIIQMIAPNNSETAARLGINIFQQVGWLCVVGTGQCWRAVVWTGCEHWLTEAVASSPWHAAVRSATWQQLLMQLGNTLPPFLTLPGCQPTRYWQGDKNSTPCPRLV